MRKFVRIIWGVALYIFAFGFLLQNGMSFLRQKEVPEMAVTDPITTFDLRKGKPSYKAVPTILMLLPEGENGAAHVHCDLYTDTTVIYAWTTKHAKKEKPDYRFLVRPLDEVSTRMLGTPMPKDPIVRSKKVVVKAE